MLTSGAPTEPPTTTTAPTARAALAGRADPAGPPAPPPTVDALRAHLLAAGLAGAVATSRERSLRSYRLFAAGDPRVTLGVDPDGRWRERDVLRLMAERCGVSGDPEHRTGPDVIDPELTLRALDAFAERLGAAAARGAPVLFGTGHPHRLLGFYAGLADAMSAAGCLVITPAQGRCVDITTRFGVRTYNLDYVRGVALVRKPQVEGAGCEPGAHTHSPLPVRVALGAAAEGEGPLPELVVGDHGWVCGAGQLGIEAIGPADTDDPALFVGEAEGRVSVVVPLDDAVRSDDYSPLTRYVLNRACLSQ
ncbi:phosphatase [Streptomyces sp. TRM64462]|uniref:phosphatase n=1 Tax=Streptomyces sp. TRM64462 TaxID=2741726 RepID=UPI001586C220|nr:phosphatase [Streptomyces sp. TRM64462]